ncbi:MAG TPA: hypothetical protein ENH75_00435 [archaeon]|nr:hypothetical protein [archaeon]
MLNALKIPFVEFSQNHLDSNCCGSGSGVRSAFPELAEKTTLKRLEEMKDFGAKTLLSACSFCEFQYSTVASKYSFNIDAIDFNTLLIELLQVN